MKICAKNVLARGEKMVIAIDGFAPVGTDQVKVQTVEVIIIANMYITNSEFRQMNMLVVGRFLGQVARPSIMWMVVKAILLPYLVNLMIFGP